MRAEAVMVLMLLAGCESRPRATPTPVASASSVATVAALPSAAPGKTAEQCEAECLDQRVDFNRYTRLCGPRWSDPSRSWRTRACNDAKWPPALLGRLDGKLPDGCDCVEPLWSADYPLVTTPACLAFCNEYREAAAKYDALCTVGPNHKNYADPRCDEIERKASAPQRRVNECGCLNLKPNPDWRKSFTWVSRGDLQNRQP